MSDPQPSEYVDPEKVLPPLYAALGDAVLSWARIELRLSEWFCALSGMPPRMGNDVFFSANSFKARVDLTAAVIDNSWADGDVKAFADAVLKKADDYSKFRNRMVHGMTLINMENNSPEPLIINPYGPPHEQIPSGLTIDQLHNAAANFSKLAQTMLIAHLEHVFRSVGLGPPAPQLPELLKQVEQLPNVAGSSSLSRRQQGRERQLQAASGKPLPKRSSGKAP